MSQTDLINDSLMKVPFYFIRHAESEGNKSSLCQGQLDFQLTQHGRLQAQSAAMLLSQLPIKSFYHSPLIRAVETAMIIADYFDNPELLPVDGLKERGWGELEGMSNQLMYQHEKLERLTSQHNYSENSTIESISDFRTRVLKTMNEILASKRDNSCSPVAIVGHGRFFNQLCELMGVVTIKQLDNCLPQHCWPRKDQWIVESLSSS